MQLWLRIQTQWRAGSAGAIGLDYQAVFQTMDRLRIEDSEGELFAGIQVMELAALKAIRA